MSPRGLRMRCFIIIRYGSAKRSVMYRKTSICACAVRSGSVEYNTRVVCNACVRSSACVGATRSYGATLAWGAARLWDATRTWNVTLALVMRCGLRVRCYRMHSPQCYHVSRLEVLRKTFLCLIEYDIKTKMGSTRIEIAS